MMKRVCTLLPVLFLSMALEAGDMPNILLLMAEDMSSRVGAFGDPVAVTPNLDVLAKRGVRYPNTFTAAGVCAPSRAAHILGMHQISTGGQHMRASSWAQGGYYAVPPEQVKAYPELLRAAGYYTYTDSKLDYQFSGILSGSGPFTIWDSEGDADAAWRGRAPGQPFFGLQNFMVTHESGVFRPLGGMPNSVIHLVMQTLRWWRMDGLIPEVVKPGDVQLPPYYPDTPTVRADIARHYNNIAYMDGEVGAVLAQLEEDGLADSTIVIWTSDHGDGLPRAKRELYDSGIKVPMIIRWPEAYRPADVEAGSVDTRLISFIDLAPTILGLAGVDVPSYLQGKDFLDAGVAEREYIFASRDRIDTVDDRQRAVRGERFKYIFSWYPRQEQGHPLAYRDNIDMVREMRALYEAGHLNEVQSQWFKPPGEEQLYDLQNDPFEINNLAENPMYHAERDSLRVVLAARLNEIEDWSEQSEASMVARFEPEGERQITPAPTGSVEYERLFLHSTQARSSLGYRLNGGEWKLYFGPVALDGANEIEAKAVRYGWEESEVITIK